MPIPEYVQRIRAAIGHDLLWLPGVTAVVTDDRDRVLLGLRSDLHQWGLISGVLDPGEEPARGLRREIAEETAVDAEPVALVEVESSDTVQYPNGDVSVYLNLTFWFRYVGGEATVADDESLDVGWFELDQLPDPLLESSARRLRAFQRFRDNGNSVALFHP